MRRFVDVDDVAKIFYDYDPDMSVYDLLFFAKTHDKENEIKVNKIKSTFGTNGMYEAEFPHCPICAKWFPIGHRQNYCDKCGQKLSFK